MNQGTVGLAKFIFELGHLKATPRSGWLLAGIQDPESVAEHTYRTSLIGMLLGELSPEHVDTARIVMMCCLHDVPETRVGDIPSVGKRYLDRPDDVAVLADQLAEAPASLGEFMRSLLSEYEERRTLESQLARDADKIECLAQALEYVNHGHEQAREWVEGSYESISSDIARRVACELMGQSPDAWWQSFVSNYRTPPPPES